MFINGGLAKINPGMSLRTKEYYEAINKNKVDLHRLMWKDEGDTSEKNKF